MYTACTEEGQKNTYGASSQPLTNEEVTREAKVKVGKPQNQQKTGKNLTLLEKIWARVPENTIDWVKNIKTQERPWGEQEKGMWNIITNDANIDEDKHDKVEKDNCDWVSEPTSFAELFKTEEFEEQKKGRS